MNKPVAKPAGKIPNNIQADRNGNIYRENKEGEWQQRQDKDWQSLNRDMNNNMNHIQQSRDRGQMRSGGFQQTNRGAGMGAGMRGGGMRRR